jgi:hypothetical protein
MSKPSEVRFAIGRPDGITSNSWKIGTHRGSVYIECRDNFQEAKVSLHPEGGWRMAFTTEAIANGKLQRLPYVPFKRDWHVWDEPPATLPDTVVAFRLVFPTSE